MDQKTKEAKRKLIKTITKESETIASNVAQSEIARSESINRLMIKTNRPLRLYPNGTALSEGFSRFDYDQHFVWGVSTWGVHKITGDKTGTSDRDQIIKRFGDN